MKNAVGGFCAVSLPIRIWYKGAPVLLWQPTAINVRKPPSLAVNAQYHQKAAAYTGAGIGAIFGKNSLFQKSDGFSAVVVIRKNAHGSHGSDRDAAVATQTFLYERTATEVDPVETNKRNQTPAVRSIWPNSRRKYLLKSLRVPSTGLLVHRIPGNR